MPILTDSLNRIKVWLQNNYPAVAKNINSGLTLEAIQAIIQTLPFSLPQEIYELYQWSQGHSEDNENNYAPMFFGMTLCSLERAIRIFPTFEDEFEECARRYIGKSLFPIFQFDNSIFLCVVGDWNDKHSSPIIFVSEINEINHKYNSLSAMMLTLAECLETDVISFRENGQWICNEEKFSPISIKHNSRLLIFYLNKLKQELIMRQHDSVLREMTISDFLGDISYLDRERRNLPNKQLDFNVIEPLVIAMQDENENATVRELARQALEELNYSFG